MSNEVVQAKRQEVGEARGGDLLSIIERVVSNPEVDIDKIDKLLAMQERIIARQAEAAYNAALADLQDEMPEVHKGGKNTHTKNAYARLEDIQATIRPLLKKYGFALSFRTDTAGELIRGTAILRHVDGHSEETTVELPSDKGASRNAVQAVGSSITYAKRYAVSALLNIVLEGEDDDGQTATKKPSTKVAGAGSVRDTVGEAQMEDFGQTDHTQDPLWDELTDDLRSECGTRGEADAWWQKAKKERLRSKHNSFAKAFHQQVVLPTWRDLPEVPSF